MISKHPSAELLVEYTSGALSIAPAISVTTHLQFCDECSQVTESLANIGGELLETSGSIPVSEDLLDQVLACLDESENEPTPERPNQAIDGLVTALPKYIQKILPDENLRWRFLSPSIRTATISVGEEVHELALHKIKAGGRAPEHNHRGDEITVVLTGSFSDEDGIYHPGDFIVRKAGEIHRPSAAQHKECICLSVLEAPIQLTGMKRVFSPFLSFSPS